jgi:hypothetical protein
MHLPRSALTNKEKGLVATKKEDWIVHGPEAEHKGFRAGDIIQWNRVGPRYKIEGIAQLKKDPKRWYAFCAPFGHEGDPRMLGLDYLTKCDVIEQLGARVDDD